MTAKKKYRDVSLLLAKMSPHLLTLALPAWLFQNKRLSLPFYTSLKTPFTVTQNKSYFLNQSNSPRNINTEAPREDPPTGPDDHRRRAGLQHGAQRGQQRAPRHAGQHRGGQHPAAERAGLLRGYVLPH